MSGPLTINHGSPKWWLSPDIWVALPSAPNTPVADPIAGTTYGVYVRVYNNYPSAVTADWNLFVCWAIPTVGPIPLPPAAQLLNGAPFGSPISVPADSFQVFKTSTNWTPSFENGGHECLVAVTYFQGIGFPSTELNGDAPPTADYSIAQHNLGVLKMGLSKKAPPRFNYAFQAANGSDKERGFVIEARLGLLSDIAAFLPGEAQRRKVLEKPGKVENLGIVASAEPHPAELENSTLIRSEVKIAPRSCHLLTLSGSLQSGNALIHVTQSVGDRVVGGLSVLVMADGE
jgi:hypothetical protein